MDYDLLSGVGDDERARLLAAARRRTFGRGEVVVHRGDPADTLHLIRKGRFSGQIVTPLGHTAVLSILGPGDAFGELALVGDAEPRSATVISLEDGETLCVHAIDFAALRARHPQMDAVLVALLSDRVRRLSHQVVEALYVDADHRVLRRLGELAESYAPGADTATVPLTQETLAGLAGTSRATVNRVLREEERRGTVELGRGRVRVVDRAELLRRALPAAQRV